MKKITFIISLFYISLTLSAQKQVRKEIRTGNKAYKEQRYETAQEHYQKAIDTNASSKEASFNLSNTYYKQQQWDNALKEYQHYLTVETEKPENMSSAWYNTGNTYLKKKVNEPKQQTVPQQGQQQPDNLKMSMEAYKNALRLNPKDEEARHNLAVVQKMIQDQQQNGGGGGQDNQQDKKDDKKDKQDKQQEQDKQNNQDKQEKQNQDKQQKQEQQQNQMSQQNMEQILNAIEQDERGTQDRVQKQKAEERKQKNQDNKRQNKDW